VDVITTSSARAPSTTPVTIRAAGAADVDAVRAVIRRSYAEYESVLAPELYSAYIENLLDVHAHTGDALTLVAVTGDEVVGSVSLYRDAASAGFGWPANRAAIRALAVDPDGRARGVGRQLLDACIERATSWGAAAIGLHTAAFMAAAVRLYERRGFRRVPDLDLAAAEILELDDPDAPLVIAYELELAPPADTYALGRSDAETGRLILQAQIYGPITRQLFVSAGITRGMKVLDLGSGAGDVALLVAELVGPEGSVVGVEMNASILDTARRRVRAAGWANVEFHTGDVRHLTLPTDFDAVVGRWILMYLDDPADLLRHALAHLHAGGVVAFIESQDLTKPVWTYPATPLHEELMGWMTPPPGALGPAVDMGLRLPRTFTDAGLPIPQLRLEAPVGGGPDWPGYTFVAESVRSLLPRLEAVGAVTAAEVDVDTLAARLRDETVARSAIQALPAVIGAWARRP
jgi:ribosomal protein S18 acetylase RimI-like enzyme/SAM-dependent methyltransferase